MKKILYNVILFVVLMLAYSACKDEALDPLQLNKIQKGKLLALRGTQLTNIYFKGLPGAEFFPRIATGTEKFVFEAEYLAEDPNSLESVDFFVLKKTGAVTDKVLVKNVPFSDFKKDSKYRNPYVEVTLTLGEVLTKLGLSGTFPLDAPTITALLSTYKFGIDIQGDLNLKDGSKALAENVVAAGLFQSDQFYPAQKLNYAVTDFCAYTANTWAGSYDATEIYSNGVYGPYTITLAQDGVDPNKFAISNFYDSGLSAFIILSASNSGGPSTQTGKFPDQTVPGSTAITKSSGSYDECKKTIKLNLNFDGGDWIYSLKKK